MNFRPDSGHPNPQQFQRHCGGNRTRPCSIGGGVVSQRRMGLAEREYHRNHPRGTGGAMSQLTPVVKWLLIANIGIFILDYVILPSVLGLPVDELHHPPILRWGAFTIQSGLMEFRIWELLSFQFLHGSVPHVLFNSIGLFFFGPWMERWWGARRFLIFYLLCGAAGALFFTLLTVINVLPSDIHSPLVGASAGIYGILMGVAVIAPDLRVMLLFPPIELSMRRLAIILMVISVAVILLNLGNEGGQAGHLGGAILGYFLVRRPWLLGNKSQIEMIRPRAFKRRFESKLKPRSSTTFQEDSEVDLILDKISRDGFQSLTEEERELLRKASERNRHHS